MGLLDLIAKNKPEFYLENAIEKNAEFPRTFIIPNQAEVDVLEIGNLIKLIFVMSHPQKDGCRAEKMWVKISNKKDEIFTGVLDNEPFYLKSIKAGDIVNFKAENIAGIFGEVAPFNEKLFAIITKKALDKRRINWVVRSDDINNEQDSGWQLFYGDESEQYLEDSSNAKIVLLEEALSFEPLLESVFCSKGFAYEYSEVENKFIEVNK